MKISITIIILLICLFSDFCNPTPIAYLGCLENYFGLKCQYICNCNSNFEWCNDGPIGDGKCIDIRKTTNQFSLFPVLNFENSFHKTLNGETNQSPSNLKSRQVFNAHYSNVVIQPVVHLNTSVLAFLSFDAAQDLNLSNRQLEQLPMCFFTGHCLLSNSIAYSHAYAGHQFGYFSQQLGDGRAVSLGQLNAFELNLKGAGRTPFSRRGDGVAVVRSSIRETIACEVFRAFAFDSSLVLSLVMDERNAFVPRDPQETGEIVLEQAAVVLRYLRSPGFVRWGSFELFASRNDIRNLKALVDYAKASMRLTDTMTFVETSIRKNAQSVARWHAIRFCHGVLNTDNIAVNGATIDFGPFSFRSNEEICNLSDHEGRYSFSNQFNIMLWNSEKFASAVVKSMPNHSKIDKKTIYTWFKSSFDDELLKLESTRSNWVRFTPENWQIELVIEQTTKFKKYDLLNQLLDIIRRNLTTINTPFDNRFKPKQEPKISCSS